MFDITDYGAVYGSTVTYQQKTANVQALAGARDDLVALGGGEILIDGKLYLNAPASFDDLGQCGIGLVGNGELGSGIYYQSNTDITAFFNLQGTSFFQIRNLTISGGLHSEFGLYCCRNSALASAGKHTFENVRVINCTKASYLNFGSEASVHKGCHFQRSPIGAIITGYPLNEDVATPEEDPADWSEDWVWSTSHFFYGCSFGDADYASRCGLMVCGSTVYLFGGMIQAKSGDCEAYAIIDGTWQMASIQGVHLDAGLADYGFLIGQYAPATTDHQTRLYLAGSHISINQSTGEAYIKARNMNSSTIGPLSVSGPVPSASAGFEIDTETCTNNVFTNCRYKTGDEIEIY